MTEQNQGEPDPLAPRRQPIDSGHHALEPLADGRARQPASPDPAPQASANVPQRAGEGEESPEDQRSQSLHEPLQLEDDPLPSGAASPSASPEAAPEHVALEADPTEVDLARAPVQPSSAEPAPAMPQPKHQPLDSQPSHTGLEEAAPSEDPADELEPAMPASEGPVGRLDPQVDPLDPQADPAISDEEDFDEALTQVEAVPASELEEAYAPLDDGEDLYSEALADLEETSLPGPDIKLGETQHGVNPRHMLEAWLAQMVEHRASDLILRAGGKPSCRVDGRITFLPGKVPGAGPLTDVLEGIIGPDRMDEWRQLGSADVALQLDGLGRFRLNAYRQIGEPALVLRRIAETPPKLEALCLPTGMLQKLAKRKRGIVLVTGVAGSGKSTTLAAMIQYMNETSERHIITLEDPVELMFREDRCVISQREVGTDVPNFSAGLRHCLRQSPDVILIGEMRDAETVQAALDATETGHLVMSTLHTVNAAQTVDRIISFFPQEQHEQIRARLADNVAAVLSQRLLPRASGSGMVPALELMTSTPRIMELLSEGRTPEINREIEAGDGGLISFNQSLRQLVEAGLIELEVALAASDKPDELLLGLRGFNTAGARNQNNTGSDQAARPKLRLEGGRDDLTLG